jgi:hypothetical protein
MKLHHTQSEDNGLAMGWVVVAGHLHLQLRHYASELVVDRNISYGQMLRSGDTVINPNPAPLSPVSGMPRHCAAAGGGC